MLDFSSVTRSSPPHFVLHGLVDPVDQPGEGLSIDGFGQRVSHIDGMIDCERAEHLESDTTFTLRHFKNFKSKFK